MVGMDSQILMHPKVWEASGHVENFDDPLIDDKNTKERFRADKLIEEKILNLLKERRKKLWDDWNWEKTSKEVHIVPWLRNMIHNDNFDNANQYVLDNIKKKYWVSSLVSESRTFEQMYNFIVWERIKNPNSKRDPNWTEVRKFEMMFYTYQGVIHDEENKIWLRPETAQGIFVNFKQVMDTTRMRLPFGIAQMGKAFRNEITPGNFLFRTREFEQMEIEYFVENDTEVGLKYLQKWKDDSEDWWLNKLWMNKEKIKFREHEKDELSHYSAGTFDVEYEYPRGRGELQGIAYRTDFDLKQHMEHSGKDLQYHDPVSGKRFVPHVIEPSFGLSRTVLAVMMDAYDEEKYVDGNEKEATRIVARFHKNIAPIKFAILPLIKKDEKQVGIAKKIFEDLSQNYMCEYDEGGAIGKRYRRQDEIGTPYCITVDYQSVDDGTVTVRDRDTMEQKRVKIGELGNIMKEWENE